MKKIRSSGLVVLFFAFAFLLSSCGGSSPGAPGSEGGGESGSMLLVESVAPSNTYLRASNLTESESVEVTIGNYDLPNRTGTASAIHFTSYTVQYITIPLKSGGPFLNNRTYKGTWYVAPNANASFTLTFWDYFTKFEYRYPDDPHLYKYNVIFTLIGYNVFGVKVEVPFQFEVTTKL